MFSNRTQIIDIITFQRLDKFENNVCRYLGVNELDYSNYNLLNNAFRELSLKHEYLINSIHLMRILYDEFNDWYINIYLQKVKKIYYFEKIKSFILQKVVWSPNSIFIKNKIKTITY
jgi:hypothetical protein